MLAWFEPDLDERLHYVAGLVALTERRVLAAAGDPPGAASRSFPLHSEAELRD